MKNISVLGSTGSIGTQTLDVADKLGMHVEALAARSNAKLIEEQARKFKPSFVALADEKAAQELRIALSDTDVRVGGGDNAVCEAAVSADTVVAAMVGISGLRPTMEAIEAGKNIALANKETLVCAGELVMRRAKQKNCAILPVDSEHCAIFQCLNGEKRENLRKVILTASGGPFFGQTREQCYYYTKDHALRHPNWAMGAKITVDSATLMNKGFELIEAMRLYSLEPEQIEIVVQRESVIHSAVEYCDGSVIAQLGSPDMRLPIQYALTYPERFPCPAPPLDFSMLSALHFAKPDLETFSCLKMAIESVKLGGNRTAVLNGANEIAVARFLRDEIPFGRIAEIVSAALDKIPYSPVFSLDDVFASDKEARLIAANA